MRLTTKLALLCATSVLSAGLARADLIPPEQGACQTKQVGDSCTHTSTGVCVSKTCSKLDYSRWDRDASSSPPLTSYDCLMCLPPSSTSTATSTATPTATSTATTTPTQTNTGTTTPTQTNTGTTTPTQTNTGTTTPTQTNTGTTTPTQTGTITATATPTQTVTATVTSTATATATVTTPSATATATATTTNGDKPPSNDDGACSIGRQVTAKRIAPWLLASAFSLLFLFGRRRRR